MEFPCTLQADIDYGFAEATTYGKIGVKVWPYKGEVLPVKVAAQAEGPIGMLIPAR